MLSDLKWRYATKKFDPQKKIPGKEFNILLESLRLSPSSMGLQPWKFIVVEDVKLRKQIRVVSWNQSQVTDASHLIVLCARRDVDSHYVREYVSQMEQVQKLSYLKAKGYQLIVNGFLNLMKPNERSVWIQKQIYIALGFLLVKCAQMRIDSCPIEGFDRKKIDSILNLNESEFTSVVMCAIGYRSKKDKHALEAKVRWDKKRVIEFR